MDSTIQFRPKSTMLIQIKSSARILLLVTVSILTSCAQIKIRAPKTQPFDDYNYEMLEEDLTYRIGNTNELVTVPAGFVTDYASIPGMLRPYFEKKNKAYKAPAIVHDWLYWTGYDREKADDILYTAARESKVSKVDSYLIWAGVRIGGRAAWNQNSKERRAGYPKVIPTAFRDNDTWPMSWEGPLGFRQQLFNNGVRANQEPQTAVLEKPTPTI